MLPIRAAEEDPFGAVREDPVAENDLVRFKLHALHIVPTPELALREIARVLKSGGVLIAPTFTHAGNSLHGRIKAFFMKLAGFPLHSRWSSKAYLDFLRSCGWQVRKSTVLKASFPLTYTECVKA